MGKRTSPQAVELHRRCDEVLHYMWDPIGVSGIPAARDEYDSYVPQVFSLVWNGSDEAALVRYLLSVESEQMGLAANPSRANEVAEVICNWRSEIAERP